MAETRRELLASVQRALRRPSCFPFVDDGPITRQTIAEIQAVKAQWIYPSEAEVRIALCEARYRDWQRGRFRVIAGGKGPADVAD